MSDGETRYVVPVTPNDNEHKRRTHVDGCEQLDRANEYREATDAEIDELRSCSRCSDVSLNELLADPNTTELDQLASDGGETA